MVLACDPLGVNERKTSRVACKKKWPGTLCHRSLGLDHKSQLRVNMDDYFLTWHFKKTLSISSIFPKKKTRLPQIMPSPQSGLQTARPPYQATSTEGDSSRQPTPQPNGGLENHRGRRLSLAKPEQSLVMSLGLGGSQNLTLRLW